MWGKKMESKQRLTRLTWAQAQDILADPADLSKPKVFEGDDGSHWAFSDELRAYQSSQHTSDGEQR
jgi:hypothetical protein